VRILDAQTTVAETAALVALVQCIARLEITEGYASEKLVATTEVLDENRFIAARDGMGGDFIDPVGECRRPATEILEQLLRACEPHAKALGCEAELAPLPLMAECTGALRQLKIARRGARLPGLVGQMADAFVQEGYPGPEEQPDPLFAASRR
jgi:carboxylate-amine ligase